MHKIELPRGTYTSTREAVAAICWATTRRGTRHWESKVHVPDAITDYLVQHGGDSVKYGSRRISRMLRLLEELGYGKRTLGAGGKSIVRFEFKPDVILTGYTPEFVEKILTATPSGVIAGTAETTLPLPELPFERPYAAEIDSLLDSYAKQNPEAYADWADSLLASLHVLLGK